MSGHETLSALNDGATPRRSNDTSHGAYGNWPRRGTQWVEYEWPKTVTVNATDVYWYDDAAASACRSRAGFSTGTARLGPT